MNYRERHLLEQVQKYFNGVGHIRTDKKDNTIRYVIDGKVQLERIVEFFTYKARLRSNKARDFII